MKLRIFCQSAYVKELISGYCSTTNLGTSAFVNTAIAGYLCPITPKLQSITNRLQQLADTNSDIDAAYLQSCLADAVDALSDHPISNYKPISQIMYHFLGRKSCEPYYSYILDINDHEDVLLHRLNYILAELDPDYNAGKRELAPRVIPLFANWTKVCSYQEIYKMIAILIRKDTTKIPLDLYRTVHLIKDLDTTIIASSAEIKSSSYPLVDVPIATRVAAIKYAITNYLTDRGYVALTKDYNFDHMSSKVRDYYRQMNRVWPALNPNTDEHYTALVALEKQGRDAFRHAAYAAG